jgi:hypothetical protein
MFGGKITPFQRISFDTPFATATLDDVSQYTLTVGAIVMCSVGVTAHRFLSTSQTPGPPQMLSSARRGPERVDAIRSADDAASLLNGNPAPSRSIFTTLRFALFAWLGVVLYTMCSWSASVQ